MKPSITTIIALCSLGLAACGPITDPSPSSPKTTLQLNRLSNGDLEFCDDNGECQSLPYDGECAIIQIDIDPETGATCERCILEDGSVVDMGCGGTTVGCVLVTLPEPDCVVCAYINGAIIYSDCVAEEEPECYTDADCASVGQLGFCVDGMCVYDDGCMNDGDCPPGFACVWPLEADGSSTDVWLGTCVPRDIPCLDDSECPGDMYCEVWCYDEGFVGGCAADLDCPEGYICWDGMCLPNNDCAPGDANCDPMPPPQCQGVCLQRPYDPCEDFPCGEGEHCELACYGWAEDTADGRAAEMPCYDGDPWCGGCEPMCVPDPQVCYGDADCGENEMCEMWCWNEPVNCDPEAGNCDPMPCEGVCVPYYPDPCDQLACADGEHCEVWCEYALPCDVATDPYCGCTPVCVADPVYCTSDAECDAGEYCEMWCYDVPVACWDENGDGIIDCPPPYCDGVCMPLEQYCYGDEDCPAGQVCELYDYGAMPPCEGPGCDGLWAPGICVDANQCVSDDDCIDAATGMFGRCDGGQCIFDVMVCDDTGACPPGYACAEIDCAPETDCYPYAVCVPVP